MLVSGQQSGRKRLPYFVLFWGCGAKCDGRDGVLQLHLCQGDFCTSVSTVPCGGGAAAAGWDRVPQEGRKARKCLLTSQETGRVLKNLSGCLSSRIKPKNIPCSFLTQGFRSLLVKQMPCLPFGKGRKGTNVSNMSIFLHNTSHRYGLNMTSTVSLYSNCLTKFMPQGRRTRKCQSTTKVRDTASGTVLLATQNANINMLEQVTSVSYLRQKEKKNKYIYFLKEQNKSQAAKW